MSDERRFTEKEIYRAFGISPANLESDTGQRFKIIIEKYRPALETHGVLVAEDLAKLSEAIMNAMVQGDRESEAALQRQWDELAEKHGKEIVNGVVRMLVKEVVVAPMMKWLADQPEFADLGNRVSAASKNAPTAADLFPSSKAKTN